MKSYYSNHCIIFFLLCLTQIWNFNMYMQGNILDDILKLVKKNLTNKVYALLNYLKFLYVKGNSNLTELKTLS